jgi:hypothetical protein
VTELWVPASYEPTPIGESGGVLIDNRTDLADSLVQEAVSTYFVENASLVGSNMANTFQTYAVEGSLLARAKFQTPANVYDEIKLARELADRDDDVRATIGMMIALAFSEGMQNHHPDEKTAELFNGLAQNMNLDGVFKRLYREWLIAQQVTTVSLFTRRTNVPVGGEGETESMVAPLVGVLPAENIRSIGSDMFDNAELAYVPDAKLETWLREFFEPTTTPARKAELRRQDPVSAVLFTGPVDLDDEQATDFTGAGTRAYRLNPRMVHRSTAPKDGNTPRPLLTADFALLEAKRLLNLMDYALLQGGMNFIVVAKKGTDERPATTPELNELQQVVRRATRTGVIVGDHRLTFEIITPKLDELLSASKRDLLGRKIASTLMRITEEAIAGDQDSDAALELIPRVIASDRNDIRRHVENFIYDECVKRNRTLAKGTPRIWFPKIILQGVQYFTDYVLKLRDRGDIPRKEAVEAAGFDWEAGVAQRKREIEDDIDEIMAPAQVPFSSPEAGPQDNNEGRPPGSSPNNGAPGAKPGAGQDPRAPRRRIARNAGETIRAVLDGEEVIRVGELTYEVLCEYPDREIGRVTPIERRALEDELAITDGPVTVVPVNPRHRVDAVKALRLAPGLSMIVGERVPDGAIVAKALCFRSPEYDALDAEETALRWGFAVSPVPQPEPEAEEELAELEPGTPAPVIHLHVDAKGGKLSRKLTYDDDGKITGSVEEEEAE